VWGESEGKKRAKIFPSGLQHGLGIGEDQGEKIAQSEKMDKKRKYLGRGGKNCLLKVDHSSCYHLQAHNLLMEETTTIQRSMKKEQ